MSKYNLGCGTTRLEGYVNVDITEGPNVDVVMDFTIGLTQFPLGEADEVVCFHALEHIERERIPYVIRCVAEMLKKDGKFIISFPDFAVTSKYFLHNKRGQEDFWEKTIFGRHNTPYDAHRSALTENYLKGILIQFGFRVEKVIHEPVPNECNMIIYAKKIHDSKSYQELLKEI